MEFLIMETCRARQRGSVMSHAAGLHTRDYAPEDRNECLRIFDSNVPESFLQAERPLFEAFLDDLPGPYLVLEDEAGAIVACGGYAVTPGTTTADLCWGMVMRDRHCSGIGRELVQVRIDRVRRDAGIDVVALKTIHATCAFYEKLGFTIARVVPDGVAPGLDTVEMHFRIAHYDS